MKTKCIASAPDKATLEKLINEYFFSTSYFINDDLQVKSAKTGKVLDGYNITVKTSKWKSGKVEKKWRFSKYEDEED